jgi:hypothetical protein
MSRLENLGCSKPLVMARVARISSGARRLWAADADLKDRQHHAGHGAGWWGLLALSWASLGVIYGRLVPLVAGRSSSSVVENTRQSCLISAAGDLGTSPLYVYSTIFDKQPSHDDVLCATSLIFWSITLVVLVKYVFIVLLADDNGEGGLCAVPRAALPRHAAAAVQEAATD